MAGYSVPMGKRAKLRKQMKRRGLEDVPAVVVCTGKKCAPREESRAVVAAAEEYAAEHPDVRVECVGCLHVCKHGPVAASYPRIRFKKHVGKRRIRRLVDKVGRAAAHAKLR